MKFTRKRIERYGLRSQKMISQINARRMLKESGIIVTENNKNCLFLHNRSESMKHFVVKAILFKILRERKRCVGTEIEIRNGIVDLIDVDNLIVYEIENGMCKKRIGDKMENYKAVKDVFFIDCRKVPENLKDAEEYLSGIVV